MHGQQREVLLSLPAKHWAMGMPFEKRRKENEELIEIILRYKKKEDMRWVKYTDLLSSMLANDNNRENHPILNQIYDILTKLHNQKKTNHSMQNPYTHRN